MPKYAATILVSSLALLCSNAQADTGYAPFATPSVSLPSMPVIQPAQPLQGNGGNAQQDALPCAAAGDSQFTVDKDGQIRESHPFSILDCI